MAFAFAFSLSIKRNADSMPLHRAREGKWSAEGKLVSPADIVRVFTRVLEAGLFTSRAQTDNGTLTNSLRQVVRSRQAVQHKFKMVSHQLPVKTRRAGVSSKRL